MPFCIWPIAMHYTSIWKKNIYISHTFVVKIPQSPGTSASRLACACTVHQIQPCCWNQHPVKNNFKETNKISVKFCFFLFDEGITIDHLFEMLDKISWNGWRLLPHIEHVNVTFINEWRCWWLWHWRYTRQWKTISSE